MEFYRCKECGNIVVFMNEDHPVIPLCCGTRMQLLKANTTDAAAEKHVPVPEVENSCVHVAVGSIFHPMTSEHFIEFVVLETDRGFQKRTCHPNDQPQCTFALAEGEVPKAVHAFCNLHGLWKAEVE